MTAVETYCKRLVVAGDVTAVYITDLEGKLIVAESLATSVGDGAAAGGGSPPDEHGESDPGRYGAENQAAAAAANQAGDASAGADVSNIISSLVQAIKHLQQLRRGAVGPGHATMGAAAGRNGLLLQGSVSAAGGAAGATASAVTTITAQFRDAVAVQFHDDVLLCSLVGRRTSGQCIGGLQALAVQLRNQSGYQQLLQGMRAASS